MKGTHKVQIQNKRVRYEFELRRNLTVLRGDSASGKTILVTICLCGVPQRVGLCVYKRRVKLFTVQ